MSKCTANTVSSEYHPDQRITQQARAFCVQLNLALSQMMIRRGSANMCKCTLLLLLFSQASRSSASSTCKYCVFPEQSSGIYVAKSKQGAPVHDQADNNTNGLLLPPTGGIARHHSTGCRGSCCRTEGGQHCHSEILIVQ